MGIRRGIVNRAVRVSVCAAVAVTLASSTVSGQTSQGNWGAEGRIGSGQSAHLIRWFSQDWSLVLGFGVNGYRDSDPDREEYKNSGTNGNVSAIFRRDLGSGRVRPIIGFGPILNFRHQKNGNSAATESTNDAIGLGGRVEFGGIASISESMGLGFVLGASASQERQKTKSQLAPAQEVKRNLTSFSVGNPQLIFRIRF